MTEKVALGRKKPGDFDWNIVHQWVYVMQKNRKDTWTPDQEEKERILKERARLLAMEETTDLQKEEFFTVLEFMLAYEHYAIEISYIQEIIQIQDLTPLPGAPPFVLGIINIRGVIHSIIDLKKRFELPDRGLPQYNILIILRNDSMKFGVAIDSIIGIRQIPSSVLKAPPLVLTPIQMEYVKGVTIDPIILLDGEKMLTDRNLVVNEQGLFRR